MRHEPRGSCALTLQNGRVRQLPKLPFYYSALRNMRKVRKTIRGQGVTILLLSFLGFKIPRQQSPPTYLKVAHNTE